MKGRGCEKVHMEWKWEERWHFYRMMTISKNRLSTFSTCFILCIESKIGPMIIILNLLSTDRKIADTLNTNVSYDREILSLMKCYVIREKTENTGNLRFVLVQIKVKVVGVSKTLKVKLRTSFHE